MGGIYDFVGTILSGVDKVGGFIDDVLHTVGNVFYDVDFTILYDFFPADIAAAITSCLVVLFFLSLFGILRRLLFFIG